MEAGLEDADPLDPCHRHLQCLQRGRAGCHLSDPAGLSAADSEGQWMDDLPAGQDLPVPPLLRKYFTHFIVKYHTTTTIRYFRHDGTYLDRRR
jgi:hypothetical protein